MLRPNTPIPVEIVLHPSWWHEHEGILFDKDFFFNPKKRVEEERHMEQALFNRWGRFGLGIANAPLRPVIGPVHLAAGFIVSAILGCDVEYIPDGSPQVIQAKGNLDPIDANIFHTSRILKDFLALADELKKTFGYLIGDIDWNGVLNTALDLYGQDIFLMMYDDPENAQETFDRIAEIEESFFLLVKKMTGTTSTAVNRMVCHFNAPLLLHSECSHTMIDESTYEKFLQRYDVEWAKKYHPFGIHYCGKDLHRFIISYGKIPHLSFFDVGWGSDIAKIRKAFPNIFMNIRLSPTEIIHQTPEQIRLTIINSIQAAGSDLWKIGLCCINIDNSVTDAQIDAILSTAFELRKDFLRINNRD